MKSLQEVEALEERLQLVKWTVTLIRPSLRASKTTGSQVVFRTAGLLGKRFPTGTSYERRLRRTWSKRLHRFGL